MTRIGSNTDVSSDTLEAKMLPDVEGQSPEEGGVDDISDTKTRIDASSECRNHFGRSVKSSEGVPCGYERGCLAGHDLDSDCCIHCSDYSPLRYDRTETYTVLRTYNSSAVSDVRIEYGPVHHDRYWNRRFPKDYQKKKKSRRRQQKQSRQKGIKSR